MERKDNTRINTAGSARSHHEIAIRYENVPSQASIAVYDNGAATRIAATTSLTCSQDKSVSSAVQDAPTTFRMPISFVRRLREYPVNANNPKHDIVIVT